MGRATLSLPLNGLDGVGHGQGQPVPLALLPKRADDTAQLLVLVRLKGVLPLAPHLAVPSPGVGTLDMQHMGCLLYTSPSPTRLALI
eukprot:1824915-Alexandrium_andersonii.AAC.1